MRLARRRGRVVLVHVARAVGPRWVWRMSRAHTDVYDLAWAGQLALFGLRTWVEAGRRHASDQRNRGPVRHSRIGVWSGLRVEDVTSARGCEDRSVAPVGGVAGLVADHREGDLVGTVGHGAGDGSRRAYREP